MGVRGRKSVLEVMGQFWGVTFPSRCGEATCLVDFLDRVSSTSG